MAVPVEPADFSEGGPPATDWAIAVRPAYRHTLCPGPSARLEHRHRDQRHQPSHDAPVVLHGSGELVESIDVLRHRGLEKEQRVERRHLGPGRERQDVTNPASDRPGSDVDDGAIQQRPATTPRVLKRGNESRPLRASRLAQRLLDDHEQGPPLRMLRVKSGQQRSRFRRSHTIARCPRCRR